MERQTLRDWVHRYNAQARPAHGVRALAGKEFTRRE
jgi:hypothetical protein